MQVSKTYPKVSIRKVQLPLRLILIVPFALQIFAAVGLVGWLSFRNGQKAVNELAGQLRNELSTRVEQHLDSYLAKPHIVNQNILDAIALGYLNVENPRGMERYFSKQMRLFEEVSYIQVGNEKKEFYGIFRLENGRFNYEIADQATSYNLHTYAADREGNLTDNLLQVTPNHDSRRRPWYIPPATRGESAWSDIYPYFAHEQVAITLGVPVYDIGSRLLGVIATDLVLSDINEFLGDLKISKSGQIFVIEPSGLLVANSTGEKPFVFASQKPINHQFSSSTNENHTEFKRLLATESQNVLTRASTQYLIDKFGDMSRIRTPQQLEFILNGQRQFLQVTPLIDNRGIEWLIVVVVPEVDFMGQIYQNTRSTIGLCIFALGIAIGGGILTARWIIKPIRELSQASQKLAADRFDESVHGQGIQELEVVAESFNHMSEKLKKSYEKLESYSKSLEGKVNQRTQELERQIQQRQAIEFALRESEQKFSTAFHASPSIIAISTLAEGRYIEINDRFLEDFGCQREQVVGRTSIELNIWVDPEDSIRFRQMLEEQKSVRNWEVNLKKEGNKIRTCLVSADLISIGEQLCVLSVSHDISDRKAAEEALKTSEERWQLALQGTGDGIFDWNLRTDKVFYSSRWKAILGYADDEISNDTQQWIELLHPEDRDAVIVANKAHINQQTPHYSIEYRMRCKDGSYKWILARGQALWDEQGKPLRMVGSHTDITERKQAEEALRKSEERWQLALEGSNDGIWDQDLVTNKVFLSDRALEILGYNREELDTFDKILALIHSEDRQKLKDEFERHLCGEAPYYNGEYRIVTKDGNYRWILARGRAQCNSKNRPVRAVGSLADVTDRKQVELELQKAKEAAEIANQAKSEFLASMSHELRTPLNGILGYAQILKQSKDLNPYRHGVEIILQCGSHLLNLINDILDLSKIEARKMELYPKEFHLLSFLTSVAEMIRIRAQNKGIHFAYTDAPQLPSAIIADEKRLGQVLINLLGNAVKFTDVGGVTFAVDVISRTSQTVQLRFSVEDTGVGITSEQIEKIFQPFEQVGSTSRRAEGSGLGLAISQKLLTLMGSAIEVSSTPGKGSRFWFNLEAPIAADWAKTATQVELGKIIGSTGRQRKIMIVDDREVNRAVVMEVLQPLGFECRQAKNGEEGLKIAQQFQPDLIITDLVMTVLDGFEMTRRLRQDPRLKNRIIIASSASVLKEDQFQSLEAGCDDFIPKPIEMEKLLFCLQKHLKLEWIYETETADVSEEANETRNQSESIAFPPSEQLQTIYQAAKIGDIETIETEAERLKALDSQYQSFAEKILSLANQFDDRGILSLLEKILGLD